MSNKTRWISDVDYLPVRKPSSHTYRLQFRANEEGIAKEVEFNSPGLVEAVQFALDDPKRRDVEIWEDGEFACALGRDPIKLEMD